MFQLNPLDLPNAWWQHLLMLVVSGIIGYIIASRNGKGVISELEERLAWLDGDLEKCRTSLMIVTTPVVKVAKVTSDDFKIIEGVGPQIEKILYTAGVQTYGQLSVLSPQKISEILIASNPRFQMHDPGTWPRQAALAAAGNWQKLKEWQEVLDGGKE